MKKNIIIISIVTLSVGLFLIYNPFKSSRRDIVVEEAKYHTTYKKTPTDGSIPDAYDTLDNLAFLMYQFRDTKVKEGTTVGESHAAFTTINIYGKRIVTEKEAFKQSVSSGIVSSGKQRFYLKDKVLLRDADKIDGFDSTWYLDTPECVTNHLYEERYGTYPNEASSYIICKETIIDNPNLIKNSDGTYTIKVKLNPDHEYAPFYYSREVLTNSNSSIIPEFSLIEQSFTFTKDWQLLKVVTKENYRVKAMGIDTTSKTVLTENFNYDNVKINDDDLNFFLQYKDLEPVGEQAPTKEDPLTLIVSSLQKQNGENTNFRLSIDYNDKIIEGNFAVNVKDAENVFIGINVGNLKLEYDNDIFIQVGNIGSTITVDNLQQIFNKFFEQIHNDTNDPMFNVQDIVKDLMNSKIEYSSDNQSIKITSILHLIDYQLELTFNLTKINDNFVMQNIYTDFDLNSKHLRLELNDWDKEITRIDRNNLIDLANLNFLLDDILAIMDKQYFNISSSMKYDNFNLLVNANFDFRESLKLNTDFTINYGNTKLNLNIKYFNNYLYLTYKNNQFKISINDLQTLIKKYTNEDLHFDFDLNIKKLMDIIVNIDYDRLIEDLKVYDNEINVIIHLQELLQDLKDLTLHIKKDTNLEADFIYEQLMGNINLFYDDVNIMINPEDYQDLSAASFLMDSIYNIIKSKNIMIELATKINKYTLDFNFCANFKSKTDFKLVVNIKNDEINFNENLIITYLNKFVYVDYLNNHLKLKVEDLESIFNCFKNYQDLNDLINNLDLNKLINQIIIENDLVSIDLNLSDLIENLNSLKLEIKNDLNGFSLNIKDMHFVIFDNQNIEIQKENNVYTDLTYSVEIINNILPLINHESINVSGSSEIELNENEKIYNLNAHLNLDFIYLNSHYEIEGLIKLSYKNILMDIEFYLDSCNNLYIHVLNQTIIFDLNHESLDNFVNTIKNKIEELGIQIPSSSKFSNETILTILNNLLIKENEIQINLGKIVNDVLQIGIYFLAVENNELGNFNVNVLYSNLVNISTSLKVNKSDLHSLSFINKYDVNFNSLDIVNFVNLIVDMINLQDYYFDLNVHIVSSNHVLADITGYMKIHDNKNKTFDFEILLNISEYLEDGSYYQNHILKLSYLSGINLLTEKGMLYAEYGNADKNNPVNDFIKVQATEDGILGLIDSLINIVNSNNLQNILDFIKHQLEIDDVNQNAVVNLNTLFDLIFIEDEQYILGINISKQNKLYFGFTQYNTLIDQINLEYQGTKINLDLYHPLIEGDISYKEKAQVIEPNDAETYTIDLSNLHYLVDAINNTMNAQSFDVSGDISISILGIINPIVNLHLEVSLGNDENLAKLTLHIPYINTIIYGKILEKTVTYYFQDDLIIIDRMDSDGTEYKIKLHYSSFIDDLVYWLLKYSMGMPSEMYDLVIEEKPQSNDFVDASKCVTIANFEELSSSLGFNLGVIARNPNLGEMSFTVNSIYVNNLLMLNSVTNFSAKFVSDVININASSLNLTNVTENGVTKVDLTSVKDYFNENLNVKIDTYYKGQNGILNEYDQLSHSVTFNYYYFPAVEARFKEGEEIVVPNFEHIIFVDGNTKKYMKFSGWYLDRNYQQKYELGMMPSHKLNLYAKWVDISIYIKINASLYNDEYLYVTYYDASLDNLLNIFDPVNIDNEVYVLSSFLYNNEEFILGNATKDMILDPVWKAIKYQAHIDNTYVDLDLNSDSSIAVANDYMIKLNDIYYVINYQNLTPKNLYNNFRKAFNTENIIEIETDYKPNGYNLVSFKNVKDNFNNKIYHSLYVLNNTNLDYNLLPNQITTDYEINAWYINDLYFDALNNINVTEDLILNPYYSLNRNYFIYKDNNLSGFKKEYKNKIETLILPYFSNLGKKIDTVISYKTQDIFIGAFEDDAAIKNVIIPSSYLTLDKASFKNCINLKNVYFSNSVINVAEDCFYFDTTEFNLLKTYTFKINFYLSTSNSLISRNWLAGKWSSFNKFYGNKYYAFGIIDLTNSFKNYDGNYNYVINNLI